MATWAEWSNTQSPGEHGDTVTESSGHRPEKTVAILQSNYIPWKGYFDLIRRVDEFILYDDAQYTRRDWRNRNKIKTSAGARWLTIPVEVAGRYRQAIRETAVADPAWAANHWNAITHSYARAPYFSLYRKRIEELYRSCTEQMLSQVNRRFLDALCEMLGIQTRISSSAEYRLVEGKTERLVEICRQVGATRYVSGPAARAYIDESQFAAAGLQLSWMDYSGYPEYRQLHPPFDHAVSVIDLLFNEGPNAPSFMTPLGITLSPTMVGDQDVP